MEVARRSNIWHFLFMQCGLAAALSSVVDGDGHEFVHWRSSTECSGSETAFGKQSSVEDCIQACLEFAGDDCNFVAFGKYMKAGKCKWKFDDACTTDKFMMDDYDMYRRVDFHHPDVVENPDEATTVTSFVIAGATCWAFALVSALCSLRGAAFLWPSCEPVGVRKTGNTSEALDGRTLHSTVCPSKWCVTKQDLLELRRKVKHAVKVRDIVPTTLDNFDVKDDRVGPSVYTVTDQFIRLWSINHGRNASWALMHHPAGLDCDLFVTHAWSEGIFEFIDKVVQSWPIDAKGAYCCMLSNPQALDIQELLDVDLEHTPFAKALSAAKYMLVAPNHKCSIYTRVWCVYEAFLAYKKKKFIYTARPPSRGLWVYILRALSAQAFGAGFGFCYMGCILTGVPFPFGGVPYSVMTATIFFFLSSNLMYQAKSLRLKGCILVVSLASGLSLAFFSNPLFFGTVEHLRVVVFSVPVFLCWSPVLVVERVWKIARDREKEQLKEAYTGQLADAQYSRKEDFDKIWEKLVQEKQDVEHAVEVLIATSMSTPQLRDAAQRIDLKSLAEAVEWSPSLLVISVMSQCWIPVWLLVSSDGRTMCPTKRFAPLVCLIWCFLLLSFIGTRRKDQRGFAIRTLKVPVALFCIASLISRMDQKRDFCRAFVPNAVVGWPLACVIAWTGINGLSRVPVVGPRMVILLLTGHRDLRKACWVRIMKAWRPAGLDADPADSMSTDTSWSRARSAGCEKQPHAVPEPPDEITL